MKAPAPEVGGEIDSYCTKCKTDTGHIIVALSGDEVKKVECKSCGGQHNYRRPKSAPKLKKVKAPGERKTRHSAPAVQIDEATWETQMRGVSAKPIRTYQMDAIFEAGEVITHGSFGLGKVEDVLRNKMKVAFRGGQKLLLCRDKRA
jgi:hypothetical protein